MLRSRLVGIKKLQTYIVYFIQNKGDILLAGTVSNKVVNMSLIKFKQLRLEETFIQTIIRRERYKLTSKQSL